MKGSDYRISGTGGPIGGASGGGRAGPVTALSTNPTCSMGIRYNPNLVNPDRLGGVLISNARKTIAALLAFVAMAAVAGCGGASDDSSDSGSSGSGGDTTLSLVAYSTPEVVYDEIIPDFRATSEGRGVGFKTSFGASGDQSRAVEAGLPADVVTFSTEPDMTRLVDARLVASDWNASENRGLVTTSVVAFVVRKGNPKNIKTWDDLLRPGIKVLTPNPFSSGAAKWNLLAAYGQASGGGRDEQAGLDYVRELIAEHVPVQDKSGREALQNFVSGDADVLLSYEYEATTAQKKGEEVDYVLPDDTIKINIDIAKTEKAPAAAQQFLDYVLSRPAQEHFVDWGYRPVNADVLAAAKARGLFPDPPGLFTIDDLGGWSRVNDEFFDIENGSIAKIEEDAGVSTAK
jgi:sulfate transport system substrate-binding protein